VLFATAPELLVMIRDRFNARQAEDLTGATMPLGVGILPQASVEIGYNVLEFVPGLGTGSSL